MAAAAHADGPAPAPQPVVKLIATYGCRAVAPQTVIDASGVHAGDSLAATGSEKIRQRLEKIPGVRRARVAGIYGQLFETSEPGLVLYLGVEEHGAAPLEFAKLPQGDATLPTEVTDAAKREGAAFEAAAARGQFVEDRSQGHSLSQDPDLRVVQEQFVPLAEAHWTRLVEVLHTGRDASQRAIAAHVIAYAKDKRQASAELTPAIRDPDPEVRNNATRALSLIFGYAKEHAETNLAPSTDLVDTLVAMLDSLEWTDRNKATALLLSIDDDQLVLDKLRANSILTLTEMSRWPAGHGMMAFMLLGRLAGMSHEESQLAWRDGKQSEIINRAQSQP